jgi:hypothetical protein
MPFRKMVIMRGNPAPAGKYPDEKGANVAWPLGALHVEAALEYGRRRGYRGIVLDVPGLPQSQTSPQNIAALKAFREDRAVTAFYGFSGGGYNLKLLLDWLAAHDKGLLSRIDLIVVLGAPKQPRTNFLPSNYGAQADGVNWEVVYRTNPDPSELPQGVPSGTETHMFGPEALLAQTPPSVIPVFDWIMPRK